MPSQHFAFHLCPSCQASYNMDFDIHTHCKHSLLGLLAPAVQLCPRGRSSGECGNAGGWLCLEDMLDLNPNRTGGCAARYESPDSALSIIDSHPASPQWEIWKLMVRPMTARHQWSAREEATLPPCGILFHDRRGLQRGDYVPRATDTCSKPHDALVHIHQRVIVRVSLVRKTKVVMSGHLTSQAESGAWWQLTELKEKKAISKVSVVEEQEGSYPRYFLVPKKTDGMRQLLDLSLLNKFIMRNPFHMLSVRHVLEHDISREHDVSW